MKIFLVYPAFSGYYTYSFGLGYISSVLKRSGHAVEYLIVKDQGDENALYKKVKEADPRLIGFTMFTSQINHVKRIIKNIKRFSDAFIVCGGIHPTVQPECIDEIPGLDGIVLGEGEFPVLELANALENSTGYAHIRNFYFRANGGIIKNEIRPLVADLDDLPNPDKDFPDFQNVIAGYNGCDIFMLSRGCIFDCSFCSNKALMDLYRGKGCYFRVKSARGAIEEIAQDAQRFNFKSIFFFDDAVSLNKDWFYDFFNRYRKEFKYPFACNIKAGTVDADMVKLLKEAGADSVALGIECGNENFRKNVLCKHNTNAQIIDTVALLKKYGIGDIAAHIIIGSPTETPALFLDTVRLCRRLRLKTSNLYAYIFHPYPATALGKLCEENNWLPHKEYFAERYEAVIDYPRFSKKDIQFSFDSFRYLVYFKFLPLGILFLSAVHVVRFYWGLAAIMRTIKKTVKKFSGMDKRQ